MYVVSILTESGQNMLIVRPTKHLCECDRDALCKPTDTWVMWDNTGGQCAASGDRIASILPPHSWQFDHVSVAYHACFAT